MTPAETKYMRIVNAIKAQVREGSLQPSGRVPSEGELMEAFRVSSITVRKAMAVLAAEGLVFRVKGKGTFVAGPPAKIAPKKIYLIFDVDDLDVSLNKIVRGIHTYLTGKDFLLIDRKSVV
jgi:GntR family transcriptional regulator of arabinose operon